MPLTVFTIAEDKNRERRKT